MASNSRTNTPGLISSLPGAASSNAALNAATAAASRHDHFHPPLANLPPQPSGSPGHLNLHLPDLKAKRRCRWLSWRCLLATLLATLLPLVITLAVIEIWARAASLKRHRTYAGYGKRDGTRMLDRPGKGEQQVLSLGDFEESWHDWLRSDAGSLAKAPLRHAAIEYAKAVPEIATRSTAPLSPRKWEPRGAEVVVIVLGTVIISWCLYKMVQAATELWKQRRLTPQATKDRNADMPQFAETSLV